jgi:hypothetical protein
LILPTTHELTASALPRAARTQHGEAESAPAAAQPQHPQRARNDPDHSARMFVGKVLWGGTNSWRQDNNNNNNSNNNNNTKHTLAGFSDYPEHCVPPSTQHRLTHTLCQAHARHAHAHTTERSAAA